MRLCIGLRVDRYRLLYMIYIEIDIVSLLGEGAAFAMIATTVTVMPHAEGVRFPHMYNKISIFFGGAVLPCSAHCVGTRGMEGGEGGASYKQPRVHA